MGAFEEAIETPGVVTTFTGKVATVLLHPFTIAYTL